MNSKKLLTISGMLLVFLVIFSCGKSKEEQEKLDKKLEKIQAVEVSIDSTLNQVDQKVEEVNHLIKDIDSI